MKAVHGVQCCDASAIMSVYVKAVHGVQCCDASGRLSHLLLLYRETSQGSSGRNLGLKLRNLVESSSHVMQP